MFNGALSHTNPDMIRAHLLIRMHGMTEEQQEIQRYQDCYHGRLFDPMDEKKRERMKPWGTKWDPKGNPIPKSQWKPLYVSSLAKWIVSFHTSKLFSEEAFPEIKITSSSPEIYDGLETDTEVDDPETARSQASNEMLEKLLQALLEQVDIENLMQDASEDGLVQGYVPVLFSAWDGELGYEILDRKWAKLEYDHKRPKTLSRLVEQYIIEEQEPLGKTRYYLYRREIDAATWREWKALIEEKGKLPRFTQKNLIAEKEHGLGFVPVVKIRAPKDRSIFADEVLENIRGLIEYDNNIKVSLTKNLDPQRYMLVDTNGSELELDDVEPLEGEKDSEPLETGTLWPLKARAVGDFSTQGSHETALKDRQDMVHEILESCHVIQVPEDNQQSGVALNMRLEPSKSFINKLRTSMGRKGLVPICEMLLQIAQRLDELGLALTLPPDVSLPKVIEGNRIIIALDWGDIIPKSEEDKEKAIFNASTASDKKLISLKSARRYVASYFGIEDLEAEIEQIDAESAEATARMMQTQNQLFRAQNPPTGGKPDAQNDL